MVNRIHPQRAAKLSSEGSTHIGRSGNVRRCRARPYGCPFRHVDSVEDHQAVVQMNHLDSDLTFAACNPEVAQMPTVTAETMRIARDAYELQAIRDVHRFASRQDLNGHRPLEAAYNLVASTPGLSLEEAAYIVGETRRISLYEKHDMPRLPTHVHTRAHFEKFGGVMKPDAKGVSVLRMMPVTQVAASKEGPYRTLGPGETPGANEVFVRQGEEEQAVTLYDVSQVQSGYTAPKMVQPDAHMQEAVDSMTERVEASLGELNSAEKRLVRHLFHKGMGFKGGDCPTRGITVDRMLEITAATRDVADQAEDIMARQQTDTGIADARTLATARVNKIKRDTKTARTAANAKIKDRRDWQRRMSGYEKYEALSYKVHAALLAHNEAVLASSGAQKNLSSLKGELRTAEDAQRSGTAKSSTTDTQARIDALREQIAMQERVVERANSRVLRADGALSEAESAQGAFGKKIGFDTLQYLEDKLKRLDYEQADQSTE